MYIMRLMVVFFCIVQWAYASPKFLTISDIHYGSKNTSQDGQDTGDTFLQIALKQFEVLSKKVDFILVLGDLPTHSLFLNSVKETYEKTVFHGLYQSDIASKPMFYVTGNNDSLTGNYQPFETNGKSPLTYAIDWQGACVHCEGLMIDSSHMYSEGFYSSYVMPGNKDIVLIALNSTQFIKPGFFSPKYPNQEHDTAIQFKWLEDQLKNLRAKQLLIALHIPPGATYLGNLFWQEEYVEHFIDLLDQYHQSFDEITILTGHTHMDEIRKIELKDKTNIYIYSTPSISRNHYNNPGMKIFTLNQNMAIKNYTTYYSTDLNDWKEEQYSAMGSADAIFPYCDRDTLSECLDGLSTEQVCNLLEQNFFYGVKSSRVPQHVCFRTFSVN